MDSEETLVEILDIPERILNETKCSFSTKYHKDCTATLSDFEVEDLIDVCKSGRVKIFHGYFFIPNFPTMRFFRRRKIKIWYRYFVKKIIIMDTKVINRSNKHFALKVVKKDPAFYQGIELEIFKILDNAGPNRGIVKCEHQMETDEYTFIFEEYLLCDCDDLVSKMSLRIARVFIERLVDALKFLHENNIAYLDLKPANIMVDFDGNIKLIDFDSSEFLDSNLIRDTMGSLKYMAPEQVKGEFSDRSDWFSVGNMLSKILTKKSANEKLFEKNKDSNNEEKLMSLTIVRRYKTGTKKDENHIAAAKFIDSCLEVDPTKRIDLDAHKDCSDVEFLKDKSEGDDEEFEDFMKGYVDCILCRKTYLMVY
ncbi:hypothetical protein MHBO_002274 [Bonamia ostreae]|uniref:Protein kinase domain-containing protein n=1 Tax=Bonamia ostreae TaxID=126728 RepID=A0ABV2ALT0_9EUKA